MAKVSETQKRVTVPAHLILWEYQRGHNPERVREELLASGIAKGTVSKIVTVLNALLHGRIKPEQVTSLTRAYELARVNTHPELRKAVKRARKAAEGSSNDEEIEALQEALEIALGLLKFEE